MASRAPPRGTESPGLVENEVLARLLEETADLLEAQEANPFRVRAYRRAAESIRALERPIREIWREGGRRALARIPGIGESLSRSIETWLETGTLGILARLRGEEAAESLLMTVPGIGPKLAHRLHHELGISSLEELEVAAHDGRLEALPGIGPRRAQAIRDQLESRLRRRRGRMETVPASRLPPVAEILEVDREYRRLAREGKLPRIAPRRFNPEREAWLPVLHTRRGRRYYTALFSNTARAHELGKVGDWVVVYVDDGDDERQWTVVTEHRGPLAGRRVVRGRERECLEYYRELERRRAEGPERDAAVSKEEPGE